MGATRSIDNQDIARLAIAAVYLGVGALHLANPEMFLDAMPKRVPRPKQVILVTGLCEIAGVIGLFTPRFRKAAGIALALYAICVFPVNIKQARDGLPVGKVKLNWWYHGPRLAFQPVFVWWALFAGKVIG